VYNSEEYMLNDKTLQEVRRESARAIQKHGRSNTCVSDSISRGDKLAILTEEVGEVARILCEFQQKNITAEEMNFQLKKELAQVASISALWLECEINIGG
jgi:hypothetical protein